MFGLNLNMGKNSKRGSTADNKINCMCVKRRGEGDFIINTGSLKLR